MYKDETHFNFFVRKTFYADFYADGHDICKYIRTFMPQRDIFSVNYIYVFFNPNDSDTNTNLSRFRYDFIFSNRWLNSVSVKRMGLSGLTLYRVYTFISNPTLWQKL